jgi:hypothetical protein
MGDRGSVSTRFTAQVQSYLAKIAAVKGVELSVLVSDILKKEIELIEATK